MTQDAALETSSTATPSRTGPPVWKRLLLGTAAAIAAFALYLLFWPVPIDPYPWEPGPDPGRTGPYAENSDLETARLVELPGYEGPEDVAIGPAKWAYEGWIFAGAMRGGAEGAIVRIDSSAIAAGEEVVTHDYFDTGGRPLGLDFDRDGGLYVADAIVGALRLTRQADGRVLADELPAPAGSDPIPYTDSIRVAPDGKVWFTAPSTRWSLDDIRFDGMETQPTGRLISYDPETDTSQLELDGLMFANGVALEENGNFVLVAEWSRYRITRKWLQGPREGEVDVFYDNLPGYPDNLSWDPEAGLFWVGLVIPRSPVVDRLHPTPFWMKILPRIPLFLQPHLPNVGWLIGIDVDGRLARNSQDFGGKIQRVTGARRLPSSNQILLTSDFADGIGVFGAPSVPTLERQAKVEDGGQL